MSSYRDRRRDSSPVGRSRRNDSPRGRDDRDRRRSPERRRDDSPRDRESTRARVGSSDRRRRGSFTGSDGIHVHEDDYSRRRDDRGRGDDRRDSRRDDRRGGDRDDELKKLVKSVFREYVTLYTMVSDETESIRKFDFMKYASRSVKDLDKGSITVFNTDLDERGNKSALEMLRTFEDTTLRVKKNLNKQYRNVFFAQSRRTSRDRRDRETRGSGDRYGDDRGDRGGDRRRGDDRRGDDRDSRRRDDRREDDRLGLERDRDRGDRESRDKYDRKDRGSSKRDDRDRRDDRSSRRDDRGDRGDRDRGSYRDSSYGRR